jgi:hypothetical protein
LSSVADRFITSRSETNFELGEHLFADSTLRRNNSSVMGSKSAPHSPAKDSQCDVEYENAMRQRLNAGISNPSVSDGENAGGDGTNMAIADATGYRILAFQVRTTKQDMSFACVVERSSAQGTRRLSQCYESALHFARGTSK